jgi:hypothetical protein
MAAIAAERNLLFGLLPLQKSRDRSGPCVYNVRKL